MDYYRYHFNVTICGIKHKLHVPANNQGSARAKVKRMFPMAERITLVRTDRNIINH